MQVKKLLITGFIALNMVALGCNNEPKAPAHNAYWNPAVKPLTDSIERHPDVPIYYYERSKVLINIGADSLAALDLEKAITLDEQDLLYPLSLGYLYSNMDKPADAIRIYKQALVLHPADEKLQLGLVHAYILYKEKTAAIDNLKPLQEKYPNLPEILLAQADIALLDKDTNTALNHLENILATDNNHLDALYLKGSLLSNRKDAATVQVYGQIFAQDTFDVYPLEKIGDYYFHMGDSEKALAYYKKCILIDLNYADGFYKIGEVYAQLDSTEKAFANYENAIKSNPTFAAAYYGKAKSFEKLGKIDSAVHYYNITLNFDKKHQEAFQAVQRLGK